jgi:uncharacterized membrane protein (DUF4010 family)
METNNVQSSHFTQVVSAFMSASSPVNVVATFRNAGIVLFLGPQHMLYYRVSPAQARCLIIGFIPIEETATTDAEVEEEETKIYLEHYTEVVAEETTEEEE